MKEYRIISDIQIEVKLFDEQNNLVRIESHQWEHEENEEINARQLKDAIDVLMSFLSLKIYCEK